MSVIAYSFDSVSLSPTTLNMTCMYMYTVATVTPHGTALHSVPVGFLYAWS